MFNFSRAGSTVNSVGVNLRRLRHGLQFIFNDENYGRENFATLDFDETHLLPPFLLEGLSEDSVE